MITPQADKYLRELWDKNPRAFKQRQESSLNNLMESVVIDGFEITDAVHNELVSFATNGSPGIVIEILDDSYHPDIPY